MHFVQKLSYFRNIKQPVMKVFKVIVTIALLNVPLIKGLYAQKSDKVYAENSGEFIFSFADVMLNGEELNNKVRFSLFLHMGQNVHYDFSDNFGVFSGYGLRNIGFITENNDVVTKRRTYALAVPLAFKAGSFKNHFYLYGGGEYELFFHYKQKLILDGDKNKFSEWFSDRTERFVPSLFGGVQFPGGINLKFKYYPGNFLNRNFRGNDFGVPVDYSRYNQSRLYFISLAFNFRTDKIKEMYTPPGREAIYVNL